MSEEKKTDEQSAEDKKEDASNKKTCAGGECGEGNNIFMWLIIIVLVIGAIVFFTQKGGSEEAKPVSDKVSEEVSAAALELIEGQLVAPGTAIEVGEVTEESGLYKIELSVEGQEVTSYMTKDLTKFIPQLIDAEELEG
ncbi:MAG: hypothetical protein ABFQ53_01620, partial [Patescibacteria group bacterium]